MKTVLCGPPHSGKSCLRDGLKKALMSFHSQGTPYPYFITGCPDGEGAWYAETAKNNPELAKQLKAAYKAKFTDEFAYKLHQDVKNVNQPLTLIDIGGRIDDRNRLIVQYATHAVILSGDLEKVAEWQDFCDQLGLKTIAIIYSDYHGTSDLIESETPILRGSIHFLERGVDVSQRPMVQKLAKILAEMCLSQN